MPNKTTPHPTTVTNAFSLDRETLECDMCENTIVTILQQSEGVTEVGIDTADAAAIVEFDNQRTDARRIQEIIDEWGYAPE